MTAYVRRQDRAALLRSTALQAAAVIAFHGVLAAGPATAQPAPSARPTGGAVVAGSASIGQNAARTTIDQSSQRAAIDWKSFDVGSQHSVQFNQPNAQAVTLNRVTGPDPSQIAGRVFANGNLIITNPSGVVFHQGAQVNANSLVVSAPGITNQNFMSGRMVFDQAPKPGARVSNAGTITVKQTGLAALVAPQVANSGTINARLGRVVLAGAEAHTIDLYGDGLVSIDVTKSVRSLGQQGGKPVEALVTNTGTILADGGTVTITAQAADGLVQNLVTAGGTIRAGSAGGKTGRIEIAGVGGSVRIEGQVSADGLDGAPGGSVAVRSSDTVTVASSATVSARGAPGGTVALGTTTTRAAAGRVAALGNGQSPGTPSGTARRVVVEPGAHVSADGIGAGGGGTVTLLSTQSTSALGDLSAKGGAAGGNGGVIEASSDGLLTLGGTQALAAPAGRGGTLYLDPYDLIVGTGTPTVGLSGSAQYPTVPADSSTSGTSYISPATLEAASRGGAYRITLNANHNLTVLEQVNLAQGTTSVGGPTGGASLELHAGNALSVQANLTLGNKDPSGATPSLLLDGANSVSVSPGVVITAVGDVMLQSLASPASTISVGVGGTATLASSIVTNGSITMQSGGSIAIGSYATVRSGTSGAVPNTGDFSESGLALIAGTDITTGTGSQVRVAGPATETYVVLELLAGRNLTVAGTVGGGGQASIFLNSGDGTANSFNSAAAGADASGSITLAAGALVNNAFTIELSNQGSPSTGSITLQAGSTIQSDTGITLNSGGAGTSIAGTIDTRGEVGSLTLNSSGDVTETTTGALLTQALTGSAASFTLTSASNQITQISPNYGDTLSASVGNVAIADSVPLIVGGAGSTGGGIAVPTGGTITLRADRLTIGPGVQYGPSESAYYATLYAPGGAVAIQPLSAGTTVTLVGGDKPDGTLAISSTEIGYMTTDRLRLGSSVAGALTIASDGNTLDFRRTSVGGGLLQLDLLSGNAISQAAGADPILIGTITANGASASLASTGNQIAALGASSVSSGSFTLVDQAALSVTGAVVGPASGSILTLQTDSLTFAGGRLQDGNVVLVPYTASRPMELVQTTPTAGRLSITQAMLSQITTGALQLGQAGDTGAITIGNAGDTISIPTASLTLMTAGAVTEPGSASLQTPYLTIDGNGDITASSISLPGPNRIGVASLASASSAVLVNAAALTLDQSTAGTLLSVQTTAGDLTVARARPAGLDTTAQTISLQSAGNLVFAAGTVPGMAVRASNGMTLTAAGAITQSDGTIQAATLSGSSGGTTTLTQPGNLVTTLGSFTAGGSFSLADARALTIGGAVSVGGGQTLSLASDTIGFGSGGSLTAPGGTVALAPYTAGAAFALSSFVPSGTVTADTLRIGSPTTGAITISGTYDFSGVTTLDLQSRAAITEDSASSVRVNTLTIEADSASLAGPNQVVTLGGASTTNGFSLRNAVALTVTGTVVDATSVALSLDAGNLLLTGTVSAPAVDLRAPGSIRQSAGLVSTSLLTGSADILNLSQANLVASVGPFAVTGGAPILGDPGSFSLVDARSVTVAGAISSAAGAVVINTSATPTADIVVETAESVAGGAFAAYAGHDVRIASGASVTTGANNLYLEAGFGANSAAATGAVSMAGTLSGAQVFLGAGSGGITLAGNVTASTSVALRGQGNFDPSLIDLIRGPIVQTAGVIATPALSARGISVSLPGANAVGTLTIYTADTSFLLANAGSLTVAGPGSAPVTTLNVGGALTLAGNLAASDTLALNATSVAQTGGAVTAGALTGTVSRGATSLTGANRIASLGDFSSAGAFSLVDQVGLALTGAVSAPTVDLRVTGAITQPSGTIGTGTLSGSAAGVALTAAGNQVTTLGAFSSSADFSLADARSLTLGGAVSAGSGRTLSLASDSITFGTGASLSAPSGTVGLAPYTNGAAFGLASFVPTGTVTASTLRIGSPTTGDVSINGSFDFSGVSTLDLQSGGRLIEAASSSLKVGTLSAQAARADLSGRNQIATLGDVSTSGGFTLADAQGLTVSGTVRDGTAISLAVAGTLSLTGSLSAPTVSLTTSGSGNTIGLGGTLTAGTSLSLNAAGRIVQTGGTITAGLLTGTAVDEARFGTAGSAAVGTLGAFTVTTTTATADAVAAAGSPAAATPAPGTLTLADAAPLTVSGPLQAGTVTLSAPGQMALNAGTIRSDAVSLTVTGSGLLTQSGTTSVVPLSLSTGSLTLALPSGGTASFAGLSASSMALGLNLAGGRANGGIDVAGLSVSGTGGGAVLTGSVSGTGGAKAASLSSITPSVDPAYTLNGCEIGSSLCGAESGGGGGGSVPGGEPSLPVAEPLPSLLLTEAGLPVLVPKSFLDTTLGGILRTRLFTADLVTIGIVRDQTSPDLLLPNVSERDY